MSHEIPTAKTLILVFLAVMLCGLAGGYPGRLLLSAYKLKQHYCPEGKRRQLSIIRVMVVERSQTTQDHG
jgi:hypothetical protein